MFTSLIFLTIALSAKCFVLKHNETDHSVRLHNRRLDFGKISSFYDTCDNDAECAYDGVCKDVGNYKTCECKRGLEGDNCEVVIDCERGKYKDCKNEKGTCLYIRQTETVVCVCSEFQVLDGTTNVCKDLRCEKLSCLGGTCRVIGGKEICKCPPGFKLYEDQCLKMNKCEMQEDICSSESTTCVPHSNDDFHCECNMGYKLKEGVTKDQNKESCIRKDKCDHNCPQESTLCVPYGDDYYCECVEGYKLKEEIAENVNKEGCIECDCGESGICSIKKGNKTCKCNDNYAEKDGYCQECYCGVGSICSFIRGAKACRCRPDYDFNVDEGICKEKKPCDPSPCVHGHCVVEGKSFLCVCENPFTGRFCEISTCIETDCYGGKCQIQGNKEYCICPDGYLLENGTCKMYCSNNSCIGGVCRVLSNNEEECSCPQGLTLVNNVCKKSKCVPGICYGGRCEKQDDGELVCVCPKGFHLEDIGCIETVCQKKNCFGGVCKVIDGEEICTCRDGYFEKEDVCQKIICRKPCYGGKCDIVSGEEVCSCPVGFVLKKDVCREE